LKETNPHPGRRDESLEDELTDLRSGEQAFMAISSKLIRAGYTTLDSISSHPERERDQVLLPPLKRGRQ